MRAGFGLVGILLGIGLLVWMFANFSIPTAREGKKAQEKASQIAGYGQDSVPASQSFATQGEFKGSTLAGLSVTSVTPGGAMDAHYGLKTGDVITGLNGMRLNDVANGDEELAKGLVAEAYQKQQTLTVRRSGRQVTLPLSAAEAAAAAAVPQAQSGAQQQPGAAEQPGEQPAPPPQQPRQSRGLQGQLDAIQDAAGGRGQE